MPYISTTAGVLSCFTALNLIHSILREGKYDRLTREMAEQGTSRLIVKLNDLQSFLPDRHKALLSTARQEIIALQRAVKERISATHPAYVTGKEFQVGFEGSFGSKHLTPRYSFIMSRCECLYLK